MPHLLNQNRTRVILIHHENAKSLKGFSRQPKSAKQSVWPVNTHCTLKSKTFMCTKQREMKTCILSSSLLQLIVLHSASYAESARRPGGLHHPHTSGSPACFLVHVPFAALYGSRSASLLFPSPPTLSLARAFLSTKPPLTLLLLVCSAFFTWCIRVTPFLKQETVLFE